MLEMAVEMSGSSERRRQTWTELAGSLVTVCYLMFPVGVLLFLIPGYHRVALLFVSLPVAVFGTLVLLIARVSLAGAFIGAVRRLKTE